MERETRWLVPGEMGGRQAIVEGVWKWAWGTSRCLMNDCHAINGTLLVLICVKVHKLNAEAYPDPDSNAKAAYHVTVIS